MSATCTVLEHHYWPDKPSVSAERFCFQSVLLGVANLFGQKGGDGRQADAALQNRSDDCVPVSVPENSDDCVPVSVPENHNLPTFSYKIRGDGFPMFVLTVCQTKTVKAVCSEILGIIAPGISYAETMLEITYSHPQHGATVSICADDYSTLICNIVPDKSMLRANLRGETLGNLRRLQVESSMLKWEETRLICELRGVHRLAETLRKLPPREADILPPLLESPLGVDAGKLQVMNDAQRERNFYLERELNGLEALVHRLVSKKGHAARTWRGAVVQGRIIPMPPDGACLFHSLGFGLGGASAHELRHEICNFIEANANTVVGGRPLQDWICWETGQSVSAYASSMRKSDQWAGPIEIAICAVLKGIRVHVYREVPREGFQRICEFGDGGHSAHAVSTVNVVLSPGHYDAFEVTSMQA